MDADLFNELKSSVREMRAIQRGELTPARVRVVHADNRVARLRQKLNLTQADLARLMGTPVSTLRGWEQGRRRPHRTARILLRMAEQNPEAVRAAAEAET